jgi:hypothetical protein
MVPSAGLFWTSMLRHDHRNQENTNFSMAPALRVRQWCAMPELLPSSTAWSAHQRLRQISQPVGLFSMHTRHAKERHQRAGTGRQSARACHLRPRASTIATVAPGRLPHNDPELPRRARPAIVHGRALWILLPRHDEPANKRRLYETEAVWPQPHRPRHRPAPRPVKTFQTSEQTWTTLLMPEGRFSGHSAMSPSRATGTVCPEPLESGIAWSIATFSIRRILDP